MPLKPALLFFYIFMLAITSYGKGTDTFRVHFALNDSRLSKTAADHIDQLIFRDILIHGQKLIVLGYTDYVGDSLYNANLSATRAGNVKAYLLSSGFVDSNVRICLGKGKINRDGMTAKDGYMPDRRVEIIIDRDKEKDNKKPSTSKTDIASITGANVKVNAVYPLNILFKEGESIVIQESIPRLQALYNFMIKNPTVSIQVEGHVCCVGQYLMMDGTDYNDKGPLSVNRARYIYTYLIQRGIMESRLKYKGYGGSKPLAYPERTEEDRKMNRRVEIRILSK